MTGHNHMTKKEQFALDMAFQGHIVTLKVIVELAKHLFLRYYNS